MHLGFQTDSIPNNFSTMIVLLKKDFFKKATLTTLSPLVSEVDRMARQNSKGKRKRVQAKTGDVLIEESLALRLKKEQEEQDMKKLLKNQSGKKT